MTYREPERGMAGSGSASSAWAPLRTGAFRTLWIAALVSNVGGWMQTVGAQWLLVHGPHAAVLVSLVQTADALPAVLFALVAGVLADIFDRVKLLLAVLAGLTVAGGALTALTPCTGCRPRCCSCSPSCWAPAGSRPSPPTSRWCPTWFPARRCPPPQRSARSASTSPGPFGLNTVTFVLYAVVLAFHPRLGGTPQSPERFIPGLRAGGRYALHAPVVQRILLRTALFLVPASALWALLPLIATSRLGLGSCGYGVLLGALGAGAIGAALIVPGARARLSANALATVASLAYAAALAAVVLSRNLGLTIVVLLPTAVAAGAATLWFWPFHQIADMDRSPVRWPEPRLPMSALVATAGWSWCGPPTPSRPTRSSGSCRPWPGCVSHGCGPGPSTGPCTRTARTRARSSSCTASRAGKSTSGSTGTGKPAPICSTATMPRHCPTLSRKPATT
jgi:hypothetical protein